MKFVCTVCGWSTESDKAPEKCPICGATTFREVGGAEKVYACEHKVGDGVEEALKVIKPGMKVMDMCTGSGCVLISILKNAHDVEGIGYDISKQAINVAKENAKFNEVPAVFERSDLFEDVVENDFDVIVSNPPYIPTDLVATLMPEVSQFEPREALDGKGDGLYFYSKILEQCKNYMKQDGYILFEIGCEQGDAVSTMMRLAGFSEVHVIKDLARNDRVVMGHL